MQTLIFIVVACVGGFILYNMFKKNKVDEVPSPSPIITPSPTASFLPDPEPTETITPDPLPTEIVPVDPEPTETITIDDPVPNDPEPTEIVPVDPEPTPEMPIKPTPVNCQWAMFPPSPIEYFYYDCEGNPQYGMGYEPWEKRSPVEIDVNKDFGGMEVLV